MNTQLVRMVHMMSMLKSVGPESRKPRLGGQLVATAGGSWPWGCYRKASAAASVRQETHRGCAQSLPTPPHGGWPLSHPRRVQLDTCPAPQPLTGTRHLNLHL